MYLLFFSPWCVRLLPRHLAEGREEWTSIPADDRCRGAELSQLHSLVSTGTLFMKWSWSLKGKKISVQDNFPEQEIISNSISTQVWSPAKWTWIQHSWGIVLRGEFEDCWVQFILAFKTFWEFSRETRDFYFRRRRLVTISVVSVTYDWLAG